MELKTTKLLGLNFTTNPKDLQDHELSDMTNLQLLKTGELIRRKGLRPVSSSQLENNYPSEAVDPDFKVIGNTSRIKYRQVYTSGREYLDVFSIDNKVYTYDQDINRFNLLYEAPGEAEVDIDSYLGYILVTSRDSNLAILQKFDRNVYLLDPGNQLLKSKGTISGKEIDFITEDSIVDTDLVDMDTDQVNLYAVTDDGGASLTETVSPSGQEVAISTYGTTNTHFNDAKIFVGHDDTYKGQAIKQSGDGIENVVLANDFSDTDAPDYARAASDFTTDEGSFEIDVKSYIGHAYKIKKRTVNGVYDGLIHSGTSNLSIGNIYFRGVKYTFPAATYELPIALSGNTYRGDLYFAEKVRVTGVSVFGNLESDQEFNNVLYMRYNDNSNSEIWKVFFQSGNTLTGFLLTPVSRTWRLDTTGRILIANIANKTYFNRTYEMEISKLQYKLDVAGLTTNTEWQDSNEFSDIERTNGSTTYKLDIDIPLTIDGIPTANIPTELALLTFNANHKPTVEGIENNTLLMNTIDTPNALKTFDGIGSNPALAPVKIYGYQPYFRVESIFSKEQNINLTEVVTIDNVPYTIPDFVQTKEINIDKAPFVLDATLDFTFSNQGSDDETEYTINPDGTDISTIRVKQYNKDNFDLNVTMSTYLAESTTVVGFAKTENMFMFINDASQTEPYLMVFKHDYGFRVLDVITLDAATYGTFINIKSFVSHTGRQYISVLTDDHIWLFRFELDKIVSVDNIDLSSYTPSDVAYIASDNETQCYLLQDAATSTIILRLIDTVNESIAFDASNTDISYYINYASGTRPVTVALTRDDNNNLSILMNQTGATPDGNNYHEYLVDSGQSANYTKVIADTAVSNVQQIKPFNTPPKPTYTTGGTGLTGKYLYFYVVKEYNSDSEVIYESYPSVFSNIVVLANAQTTLDAKAKSYTPFNLLPDSVTVNVFRAKITSIDKIPRLTDFYDLSKIGSGTIGQEITMTDGDEDGIYDIPSIVDDADDVADLVDLQKYLGFTEYYPRCKFVEVFNNVIYLANDREYPNNIYFSSIFDPTDWRPQNTLAAEAFTNDAITGIMKNDGLYIFTNDSVNYVNGDGTNVILQTLTREVGCVDPRTLQLIQNHILFLSERGFYWIRQNNFETFDTAVSKITHKFTFGTEIQTYYDNFTQEYRVIYDNNKMLIYSLPLKTWFKFKYPYERIMTGFTRENRITDIPENILIVRNEDADGNDVYRLLVEDDLISYDFIRGEGTGTITQDIVSTLYSKAFEMENPYAEKIWRRIFLDTLNSHNITGYISNDFGEFTQLVRERKRTYFNNVPLVWFRFADLFGKDLYDYGDRGISGITTGVIKNQYGKIDRCYKFEDSAYCNIKDIPQTNDFSMSFWFNHNSNSENEPLIFSDGEVISLKPLDVNYSDSDFTYDLGSIKDYTTSGTDVNLLSPSDLYRSPADIFCPAIDADNGSVFFKLGDYTWFNADAAVGIISEYSGNSVGTTYGVAKFTVLSGTGWFEFANATFNGLQKITLSLSDIPYPDGHPDFGTDFGDGLGGYVEYYYNSAAWTYAGLSTDVFIIAQNGSVYADSIAPANLIVRWDGQTGAAGSATPDVTNDIPIGLTDLTSLSFIQSTGVESTFHVGSNKWVYASTVSSNGSDTKTWTNTVASILGGAVYFSTDTPWDTFSNASSSLYSFDVPDASGGNTSINIYYDKTTWEKALKGSSANIVIAKTGAVYIGSISPINLIVDENGVAGYAGAAHQGDISVYVNHQNFGAVHIKIDGTEFIEAFGGTATYNDWVHGAFVFNSSTEELKAYVNGVLVHTVDYSSVTNKPVPFKIIRNAILGRHSDLTVTQYNYTGLLDDFRIYNTALTDENISDIYKWGEQSLQFDKLRFTVPKGVNRGRSAMFKFTSDDFMQIRNLGIEYNPTRIR